MSFRKTEVEENTYAQFLYDPQTIHNYTQGKFQYQWALIQ